MKVIKLAGKHSAYGMLVDDDIYDEMIDGGRWYGMRTRIKGTPLYAYRPYYPYPWSKSALFTSGHRLAGVLYGVLENLKDPLEIDHIDHNGLNNTRANIRAVTRQENQWNRLNVSSNFRGVSWNKRDNLWYAVIRIDGKTKYITSTKEQITAAKAWDVAARELGYPESALNFPQGGNI
jgi:hypothetical protein